MKKVSKKIIKHVKKDIKDEKMEIKRDKDLLSSIKKDNPSRKLSQAKQKMKKVMKEFDKEELHSGSKKGPIVKNRKQALAIAYSEAKRSRKKSK